MIAATNFVRRQSAVPATERYVLLALATRVDGNMSCFPGRRRIANDTGLAPDTVGRAIRRLEAAGLITVERGRSMRGNIQYRSIRLNIPNDGSAFGVDGGQSLTPGELSDGKSFVTDTAKEDLKLQVDLEPEGKMPEAGTSADLTTYDETLNGEETKNAAGEKTPSAPTSAMAYVIRPEDKALLESLTWSCLRRKEIGSRPVLQSVGGALVAPQSDVKLLIDLSELAMDFADGCRKSPKARVAFWHRAGRLCYPGLPRFNPKHKLTNQSAKQLHQLFEYLGRSACFAVGHAIRNWTAGPSGLGDKAPNVCDMFHAREVIWEDWRKTLDQVEQSEPLLDELMSFVGV